MNVEKCIKAIEKPSQLKPYLREFLSRDKGIDSNTTAMANWKKFLNIA
jgi:hypothetical protein